MYIYMGITYFTRPTNGFNFSLGIVSVRVFFTALQKSCAPFIRVVHVSKKLYTFHGSSACFTRPLVTFVFNCVPISKNIGAIKHVFSDSIRPPLLVKSCRLN